MNGYARKLNYKTLDALLFYNWVYPVCNITWRLFDPPKYQNSLFTVAPQPE